MNYKVLIASVGIAIGSVCSAYAGVKEDLSKIAKLQETINSWRNKTYDQTIVNERNTLGQKYEALIFSHEGKTYTAKLASAIVASTPQNVSIEKKELEDLITIQNEINSLSKDGDDSDVLDDLVEERDYLIDHYNINDAPGNTVAQKARYVISQLPTDEPQKTLTVSPKAENQSQQTTQPSTEVKSYSPPTPPHPKRDQREMKLSSLLETNATFSSTAQALVELPKEISSSVDSPYQTKVKQMLAREFHDESIDTFLQSMEHQQLYVKSGEDYVKVEGIKLDKRGFKGKVSIPRDATGKVKEGYKAINGFTVALSYQNVRDALCDPMRGRIEYELLTRKETRKREGTKPPGKDLLYNGTPLSTIVEHLSASYRPDKKFEKIVDINYLLFKEKLFEQDITPPITNFLKNSMTLALQKKEFVAIGTKGSYPVLGLFDGKKGEMKTLTLASVGRVRGDKLTMNSHRFSTLTGLDELTLTVGRRVRDGLFTGHKEFGVAGDAIHPRLWMDRFVGKSAKDIRDERKSLRTSQGCVVIPREPYASIRQIAKENGGMILAAFAPEPMLPPRKRYTD